MGFLIAAVALVGSVLLAALVTVLADEFKAWLPWIAGRMTRRAVSGLPKHLQSRYSEEWHSHLAEVPGVIGKLVAAVGFLRASPKMVDIASDQSSQVVKPAPAALTAKVGDVTISMGWLVDDAASMIAIGSQQHAWLSMMAKAALQAQKNSEEVIGPLSPPKQD